MYCGDIVEPVEAVTAFLTAVSVILQISFVLSLFHFTSATTSSFCHIVSLLCSLVISHLLYAGCPSAPRIQTNPSISLPQPTVWHSSWILLAVFFFQFPRMQSRFTQFFWLVIFTFIGFFYHATLCVSAVFVVARCPSVRLSLRHVGGLYPDA